MYTHTNTYMYMYILELIVTDNRTDCYYSNITNC